MSEKIKDLKITGEELIEFMRVKCSESSCVACKGDKFSLLGSDEHGAWRFEVDAANTGDSYLLPSYGITCNNCGWIRHHSAVLVNRWVAQYREGLLAADGEAKPEIGELDD
jgi:predicted nucleic-acid-binding Zn-ribbon protein